MTCHQATRANRPGRATALTRVGTYDELADADGQFAELLALSRDR
ncbi:hypothetical protein ACWD0J_28480 [Streptomyces sp. NPDC003011]